MRQKKLCNECDKSVMTRSYAMVVFSFIPFFIAFMVMYNQLNLVFVVDGGNVGKIQSFFTNRCTYTIDGKEYVKHLEEGADYYVLNKTDKPLVIYEVMYGDSGKELYYEMYAPRDMSVSRMDLERLRTEIQNVEPFVEAPRRKKSMRYYDDLDLTLWRYANDTVYRSDYYCENTTMKKDDYSHPLPLTRVAWEPMFYEDIALQATDSTCVY